MKMKAIRRCPGAKTSPSPKPHPFPSTSTSSVCSTERKFGNMPVCGVLVTYHPSHAMVAHLGTVMNEVQALVVVDNGSSVDEVQTLKAAGAELGFHLVRNEANLGIAEALNQG